MSHFYIEKADIKFFGRIIKYFREHFDLLFDAGLFRMLHSVYVDGFEIKCESWVFINQCCICNKIMMCACMSRVCAEMGGDSLSLVLYGPT